MSGAGGEPRELPSVDRVLRAPDVAALASRYDRDSVARQVRMVVDTHRQRAYDGERVPALDAIVAEVARRIAERWHAEPRGVINASGVILHTNLGRAPLSEAAIDATRVAAGYVNLEYDVGSGERGSRHGATACLLQDLTGAESGIVTVNNAAAVTLALAAIAAGRDVLVARGHAVEIGGGFRIPSVLRQSRARLVDVGTTNRTRASDYAEAISPKTAAILLVHASNFEITGYTEQPQIGELADLAHRHSIALVVDNGSGSIIDTTRFGLRHEPTPSEAVDAGADVVAFSGDKLLGGPQAGILIGRNDLIAAAAKHPLARSVRPDKLTLAALNATLIAYLEGTAIETLPIWRMIAMTVEAIRTRAEAWQKGAQTRGIATRLLPGESTIGGGSLPGETLRTVLIELPAGVRPADLRRQSIPVVARASRGRVHLDLRTVPPDQDQLLLSVVGSALEGREE